jgi:hypothetical protein
MATAARPAASGTSTKLRCRPPRARGVLRCRLASSPRPARLPPLPPHLRPRMGEWAKTGDDERGTMVCCCQTCEGSGKWLSRSVRQQQRRSRAKQAWCAAKLRRRCSDVVCTIQLMGRAQPVAVPRCLVGPFWIPPRSGASLAIVVAPQCTPRGSLARRGSFLEVVIPCLARSNRPAWRSRRRPARTGRLHGGC